MRQYKYVAMNINKEKFEGTFLAENEKDLAVQLAKQNLYLVSASLYSGKTPSAFFTMGTGKVNMTELTMFCRQFAIMISTGIPVLECLENLKDQAYSKFFSNILQVIYEDVKSGIVLSEALNKHSKVFPDFFRSMIYVGEVSGNLDTVLEALADYYEKDTSIKKKTKSAFSYPLMLLGMTVGIVILMVAFVIPTFRETLSSLNVEISGFTKVVYAIADFFINSWLYILAAIAVIGVGLFFFLRTTTGIEVFDKFKVSAPLIKNLNVDIITSRFARAFALMISSGIDISQALDDTVVVIGNKDAEKRFTKAAEEVKHGEKLATAFGKYKLFPPIMLQMVAVGERTASLDNVLNRSCHYFDEQVENTLNSIVSKIQPIMLMIMGIIIALMFIAVYSPMISIMQNLV